MITAAGARARRRPAWSPAPRRGGRHRAARDRRCCRLSTSDYSGLDAAVAGIQDALAGTHTNLVLPSLRVDSVSPSLYERISRERPVELHLRAGGRQRSGCATSSTRTSPARRTSCARRPTPSRGRRQDHEALLHDRPADRDRRRPARHSSTWSARVVRRGPAGRRAAHRLAVAVLAEGAHPLPVGGPDLRATRSSGATSLVASGLRGAAGEGEPARSRISASWRPCSASGDGRLADGRGGGLARRRPLRRLGASTSTPAAGRRRSPTVGRRSAALRRSRATWRRRCPGTPCDGPVDRDFLRRGVGAGPGRRDHARLPPRGRAASTARPAATGSAHVGGPAGTGRRWPLARLRRRTRPPPRHGAGWRPADAPGRSSGGTGASRPRPRCWYRLEYRKQGAMVFLGHLDFQRQLQFALRRSSLPVAYSKGYHPHPLLKFGPPLPVGVAGEREVLDLALAQRGARTGRAAGPRVARRSRRAAGGGGRHHHAAVDRTAGAAARLPRRVARTAPPSGPIRRPRARPCTAFLAADRWLSLRRRPKGDAEIDARGLVPAGGLVWETGCRRVCRRCGSAWCAGEGAGLPVHDFLGALFGAALPEPRFCSVTRTGMSGLRRARALALAPGRGPRDAPSDSGCRRHLNG